MRSTRPGLTLVELLVVVGIIAALVGLGLPAMRAVLRSFQSEESARVLIQTTLNSARAMAQGEQRYIGVRFQPAYCPPQAPTQARQYMVLIVYDPDAELASRFRAIRGIAPIPLPETVGVMDMHYQGYLVGRQGPVGMADWDDAALGDPDVLRDLLTFSIVFSPAGQLAFKEVCVRDGGDMFNTARAVAQGAAMFVQDDTDARDLGYAKEESREVLILYDTQDFRSAAQRGRPVSEYLRRASGRRWYVNPYSGTLVKDLQDG